MKIVTLPLAELLGLVATRGMLGIGLGMLLGDRIRERPRHIIGGVLAAIGVASTIPLGLDVLKHRMAHT